MTPEELLKPRYKVIADYPKSIHPVGTIIRADGQSEDLLYCDWNGPRCRDYPHLFKKLEWWEHREEKDMPQYLKSTESGEVFKVTRYFIDGSWTVYYTGQIEKKGKHKGSETPFNLRATLPATEEEYNQQNKTA